jgi:hypothetical protein
MEIQVDVSISDYQSGGNLRLSDRVTIDNGDFDTMSRILKGFDTVLKALK